MTINRTNPLALSSMPEASFVRVAVVAAIDELAGRIGVRLIAGEGKAGVARARLAIPYAYRPAEGDRVLVAEADGDWYVIGVVLAKNKSAPAMALPDGGTVEIAGNAAEIRDEAGRLVVRYENGSATIAAPSGDLTLAAPDGKVVVRSGKDIALEAGRDLVARADRDVEIGSGEGGPKLRIGPAETSLQTERLAIDAGDSRVTTKQATVLAQRIATTAGVVTQTVERLELQATRIVERAQDTLRHAAGLAESRAGRVRALVDDVYSLYSRRTTMNSTEDTSIDGKKILLG